MAFFRYFLRTKAHVQRIDSPESTKEVFSMFAGFECGVLDLVRTVCVSSIYKYVSKYVKNR